MVLMKNAAGNAFFYVPENMVEQRKLRGFIVVEDAGDGTAPSPTPLQDEKSEVLPEAPVIKEVSENPLMMNGLYFNQMNREQMMAWMDREGLPYNKRGTKAEFLKIYDQYKKELKANKR